MKGKLYLAAVSMLVLTLGSLSVLVLTASGQGSWTALADTPDLVRKGGALTYTGGDYIYAFRGANPSPPGGDNLHFWRYDISADSWTRMADAPGDTYWGSALSYTDDDYIYALKGNGTNGFWRYSISGDSWEIIATTPDAVGEGGALTYDGGDYIYALRGNDTTDFWRYSISTDSWDTMESTLAAVGEGGALSHADDQIYALRGSSSTDFWRFKPEHTVYLPLVAKNYVP